MRLSENSVYVFDFDTALLPQLEFEYFLEAKKGDATIHFPQNAPQESLFALGESEDALPEIPEDLPHPGEEERRFRLPLSIGVNGNVETQIKEKTVLPDAEKTNANGNVRIFRNISKGDFQTDINSNFSYSNLPFDSEKQIDLTNMSVAVTKAGHTIKVGDIDVYESEFSMTASGKRGIDYTFNNTRAYLHLFDVNSQQLKGFNGFGLPKPDTHILGGIAGYSFFQDTLSLKTIYISGKDDPSRGENVGYSPYYQSRKGDVIALRKEGSYFKRRLNVRAEFARSNFDGDLEDQTDAVSDNAYRVEGDVSFGKTAVITARGNYQNVGKEFNSIGQQYTTNNQKGYEANLGFSFKGFNLSAVYSANQDNVNNDPSEYTTDIQSLGGNMSLNIASKVSVNLGYRRDKQDSSIEDVEAFSQDSLTEGYNGSVMVFLSQSVNLNFSCTKAEMSSVNNPYSNSSTLSLNLGGSVRAGKFLMLNPSLGYSKMLNRYTNEETTTYNSFLTAEIAIVPRVFSINISGSFNRMDPSFSGISDNLSLQSGLMVYLDKLIKIASLVLSINGSYQYSKMPGFSDNNYRIFFSTDISFE